MTFVSSSYYELMVLSHIIKCYLISLPLQYHKDGEGKFGSHISLHDENGSFNLCERVSV